ncbi:related to integral membrane protein [Cephalotrichum gorgonifer]|uniref:Related to integral membrane protein n=1 Tax=Cephalotrichum gorgonifer TaxID=2041049 RepID=A0AAE8SRM9_9PEZI|nr:related to integral membrane protein [Cephalotrichum gorgonifer]
MVLSRVVNIILRAAEMAFAAIVAGITGWILARSNKHSEGFGEFVYTEVIAAITILVALIWLIPFSSSFIHWPFDFFVSIWWFAAFGVLVHLIGDGCGYIFNWDNVSPRGDMCGKFKADIAFSFLLAICFLASGLVGLLWVRKKERQVGAATTHHRRTRGWHGRSRV